MIETRTEMMIDKGLANTIAAESQMSFIDGQEGVLEYVGIDIDSLARNSTFEETVFLLWNRRLPTAAELVAFNAAVREAAPLPDAMYDIIRQCPKDATPMHALRTLASALAMFDPEADDPSEEANERKALRLLARIPALIAGFDRHRKNLDFVKPTGAGIAADFLTMLRGEAPTETMARAFDVCLILHADHGFNASTFASMVTISTLSDMYSAITTAIGTLKGPLHGGANEAVMHMLDDIEGGLDAVEPYIKGKLERREKVMGFGHRVYKAVDPRATYLKTFAKKLADDTGNHELYEMSSTIERIMTDAVGAKGIYPNVDFYSATTYYSLGLDIDLFTPIFALSRVAGWAGHCIEYLQDNKLMRPRCDYTGPHGAPYVAVADR